MIPTTNAASSPSRSMMRKGASITATAQFYAKTSKRRSLSDQALNKAPGRRGKRIGIDPNTAAKRCSKPISHRYKRPAALLLEELNCAGSTNDGNINPRKIDGDRMPTLNSILISI